MKKKIIAILVISWLLTATPSIVGIDGAVSGEQSLEGESFDVEEDFLFGYDAGYKDFVELFSYNSGNGPEKLPRFVPGELIVKFEDDVEIELSESTSVVSSMGLGMESVDQLNNKYGLISVEELFPDTTMSSLSNIYKFTFPFDTDIIQLMKDYISDDDVVYAEPNFLYTTSEFQHSHRIPSVIPNDPYFSQQWALHNTGQTGGISDADIDASEAWVIEKGSSDVVIAIIDTGVDYNHEDLADNIWINGDEIPDNGIDDDDNGFVDDIRGWDFVDTNIPVYPGEDGKVRDNDPMDFYGHGTHCSGIAGAMTNNTVGVAGVCWYCQIMPIRAGFKGEDGNGYIENDDAAAAIEYAANEGADVISMSWGGYEDSQLIKSAIDYAYNNGVVIIASAGNENTYLDSYPASYDNVIAVAATDGNDCRAGFSNYGSWVDVAAPGVDIPSTIPNDIYETYSGTSMACPHVAGLAALLLSKNSQCPYPAQMVKSIIRFTTDNIDTDQDIGTGRINAYKALLQKPFAALLDSIPSWEDVKGTIDITGIAWGENFQYFVLEEGLGENPSSWTELKNSSTPQSGVFLSLNTKLLSEGLHTIRLKAIYSHGIFADEIQIYVNNEAEGTYIADIFVSNCFDSSTPGWGVKNFNSIQDGVDHAESGDTVFVYDGIYHEDIGIEGSSKSSISLIGQNKNWTIIDGIVNITSTFEVTLSGFTMRRMLILEESSEITVSYNKVQPASYMYLDGIVLFKSKNSVISNNIFQGPSGIVIGIEMISSHDNIISNNSFANFLISVASVDYSRNNNVIDNIINGCDIGIFIWVSGNNFIKGNHLKNVNSGFYLCLSFRNTITKNFIENIITNTGEYIGINLELLSSLNKIIGNHIEINEKANGVCIGTGTSDLKAKLNEIYYNNFIMGDGEDVIAYDLNGDSSTNVWYKYKFIGKSLGNYWSNYQYLYPGARNDGTVWDTPYEISCNESKTPNKDKFPVVDPFDIENIKTSCETTEELTSEETESVIQLKETINNLLVSEEQYVDILLDYQALVDSLSQPISQQSTPTSPPSSSPTRS